MVNTISKVTAWIKKQQLQNDPLVYKIFLQTDWKHSMNLEDRIAKSLNNSKANISCEKSMFSQFYAFDFWQAILSVWSPITIWNRHFWGLPRTRPPLPPPSFQWNPDILRYPLAPHTLNRPLGDLTSQTTAGVARGHLRLTPPLGQVMGIGDTMRPY